MNQQGLFQRSVVTVKPVPQGMADILNQLDGLYTLLLRGLHKNAPYEEQEIITSITRAIDAYRDFRGVLNCAENPDPRFIISYTTEAGIECKADDRLAGHRGDFPCCRFCDNTLPDTSQECLCRRLQQVVLQFLNREKDPEES